MINGWFPNINANGDIASGQGEIYVNGNLVDSGYQPKWLDTQVIVYGHGDGTRLRNVISGSVFDIPFGCNRYAADGGYWQGLQQSNPTTVRLYSGSSLIQSFSGRGGPAVGPAGDWANYDNFQSDYHTAYVNGSAIYSGMVMDISLSSTRACLLLGTGTYTRRVLILPDDVDSTVEDWEQPIMIDGPSGESWVLSLTQTGLILRPAGSNSGYKWGGDWYNPHARFVGGRFIIAASDNAGAPKRIDVSPSEGRINLKTGAPAEGGDGGLGGFTPVEEVIEEITEPPVIIDMAQEIRYLLEPIKLYDPRLHQALDMLVNQVSYVTQEVAPISILVRKPLVPPGPVDPPTSPRATIQPTSIRLSWDWISGAQQYEVRFATLSQIQAQLWDNMSFVLRTTSTVVDVLPFKGEIGYYAFKSVNSAGAYSTGFTWVLVQIRMPDQLSITGDVIDNNVQLSWRALGAWIPDPGWLQIDKYEIQKNGIVIGETRSSFISIFEIVSGTFNYSVIAIDIIGNRGSPSTITLTVSTPPDYVLQGERVDDLTGGKLNVTLYYKDQLNKLLGPVNLTQTWEEHFVGNGWSSPQDQIDAGYPIYCQPAPPPADPGGLWGDYRGYYEHTIDLGTVLNNTILTVNFNYNQIDLANPATLNIGFFWGVNEGVWDSESFGSFTQYITAVRYLYFWIPFYGNDKALAEVFNITLLLSLKREIDAGAVYALAADATGTVVSFNKAFKDIESITVTPKSSAEPLTAIFDFVDVPDPTFFKVLVFDTIGHRKDATVEWKARGLV